MILPVALERLIAGLARLPGVGEKTATRLAFFVLRQPDDYALGLSQALIDAISQIRYCVRCFGITEDELCPICTDTTRDHSTVCVVEGVPDLIALDAIGEYRGSFHVLHGVIAPLRGVGPEDLRIAPLQARLAEGTISELIAATNVGVEGEATALYIKRIAEPYDVKVTRIATGIPMGGDLEYMDQITLSRALAGRTEL